MKKIILALCFVLISTNVMFAQLKVRKNGTGDDGSVHIGYTGYPNIYMGSYVAPAYPTYNNGHWGIEVWGENFQIWKPWPSPIRNTPVNGDYGNYYLFITPANAVGIGKVPTRAEICLDVNGNVYASNVLSLSDGRLKSNIQSLSSKANNLYKLNGKFYSKHLPENNVQLPEKKHSDGMPLSEVVQPKAKIKTVEETEFGFIAQELKEVYPELVSVDTLGYHYVNYVGLIPVLVEALKEQKVELDNIKEGLQKMSSSNAFSAAKGTVPMLFQNSPNPFSQSTQIKYYIPKEVNQALLCIYDMQGKQLKQITLPARGEGSETIHGSEFSAGIYLYALITDGVEVDVKRMILTE